MSTYEKSEIRLTAESHAKNGVDIRAAYRSIFGRPMPYARQVLLLRIIFALGYKQARELSVVCS
jgi:hypothetical protein